MQSVMTMAEVLSKIKKIRNELDEIKMDYISQETSRSRLLLSLYNPMSNITSSGIDVDKRKKEIQSIDDKVRNTMRNLLMLLTVKEQVNATHKIKIPSLFNEEEMELTVAQALVYKNQYIKEYYIEYLNKLEDDYYKVRYALNEHQKKVMSNDKIETYVLAKLNSLNLTNNTDLMKSNYDTFATEYRNANTLDILDPLDVQNNILSNQERVDKFYETLDLVLMEFNVITKIWIDFDCTGSDFWGYYNN